MSTQNERRRRVVRSVGPAFGLLAAGLLVWQGSYAAFSATTQDNSNAWSSGSLSLLNNGGTGTYAATTTASFGGANIKPGSTGSTCLTVKGTGTAGGTLAMYRSALADPAGLGAQIKLTIDEAPVATDVVANCTNFPATGVTNVATGIAVASFQTAFAGAAGATAMATGTSMEAYRVNWTFASTGSNAGDNALQTKTVTAGFTWELQ